MRDYEIVYIFDSSLDSSVIDQKLERFNGLVADKKEGGEIVAVEQWGKRHLAYPIQKQDNGYYVVVQFRTDPERLIEFERAIKLDEQVLRHLVVLSEGEMPTPNSSISIAVSDKPRNSKGDGDESE